MRSFARELLSVAGGDGARRERVVLRAVGYTYGLMAHLRGEATPAEAGRYTPGMEGMAGLRNVPDGMLRAMGAECGAMLAEGEFGEQVWRSMDERMCVMASLLAAVCAGGNVGLGDAGVWLVAYAFFGLDALGDELEEPFGESLNALPLWAMARTMEVSLLEAVGASEVPEFLRPVDSVLR